MTLWFHSTRQQVAIICPCPLPQDSISIRGQSSRSCWLSPSTLYAEILSAELHFTFMVSTRYFHEVALVRTFGSLGHDVYSAKGLLKLTAVLAEESSVLETGYLLKSIEWTYLTRNNIPSPSSGFAKSQKAASTAKKKKGGGVGGCLLIFGAKERNSNNQLFNNSSTSLLFKSCE